MTERMKESIFFLHHAFPVQPQVFGKWHGCDVNESLKRLLGWTSPGSSIRDPWRVDSLSTLVGSSRVVLRRQMSFSSMAEVRMMRGVEYMRCIGWDFQDWAASPFDDKIKDEVLISLAGNAYSAYSFGIIAASTIASMGLYRDAEGLDVNKDLAKDSAVVDASSDGVDDGEDESESD
jgi:hypothetical protein